jgi:hypothetical protein
MFNHTNCLKIKYNIKYDVDLLVGIFLNDVNLLAGLCLFHNGFPHETLNTPPIKICWIFLVYLGQNL